jgi:hypothetical protein
MTYVSIKFHTIDDYILTEGHYIISAVLMGPSVKTGIPLYASYTINGDWVHYDTNPKLILTEKINALIALWFRKDPIFTLYPIPVTMSKIKQTQ